MFVTSYVYPSSVVVSRCKFARIYNVSMLSSICSARSMLSGHGFTTDWVDTPTVRPTYITLSYLRTRTERRPLTHTHMRTHSYVPIHTFEKTNKNAFRSQSKRTASPSPIHNLPAHSHPTGARSLRLARVTTSPSFALFRPFVLLGLSFMRGVSLSLSYSLRLWKLFDTRLVLPVCCLWFSLRVARLRFVACFRVHNERTRACCVHNNRTCTAFAHNRWDGCLSTTSYVVSSCYRRIGGTIVTALSVISATYGAFSFLLLFC